MAKRNESKAERLERIRGIVQSQRLRQRLREQQKREKTDNRTLTTDRTISQHATALSSSLLKLSIVTFSTLGSSLSVPVFTMLLQTDLHGDKHISLVQKIIVPLLAYIKIIVPRQWLLWNSIGHRLDRKPDADILAEDPIAQENDSHRVFIALFACNTGFTNAFLATFLALKTAPRSVALSVSVTVGLLNFLIDLYTELPAAFRKHVESKQNVSHFFHQKHIIDSATPFAYCFGIAIREGLPPITGLIGAAATMQTLDTIVGSTLSIPALTTIKIPLAISIYFAMAYATQFKLIQLRDNLCSEDIHFDINNCLSQSSISAIKLSGKVISGEIIVEILERCKLATDTCVNTTLALAAIGLSAVLYRALQQGLSSTNAAAVYADQEGLAMSYVFEKSSALQLAPKLKAAMGCVAITFAAISMFTKSATIRKQAHANKQQKIYIARNDLEQNDVEIITSNP